MDPTHPAKQNSLRVLLSVLGSFFGFFWCHDISMLYRTVRPNWINLWKKTRMISSLMPVFSDKSSNVHPRPRYLRTHKSRNGIGVAGLRRASLTLPSLHPRVNKGHSLTILTNSRKHLFGRRKRRRNIFWNLGFSR